MSLGGGLLSFVFCPMNRNRRLFSTEEFLCRGEGGGLVRRLFVSAKENLVTSEAVIMLEPLSDVGEPFPFPLGYEMKVCSIGSDGGRLECSFCE